MSLKNTLVTLAALSFTLTAFSALSNDQTAEQTAQPIEAQEMRDKHPGKHMKRKAWRKHHRSESGARRLEQADTNKDGQLDLAEYLTNAENHFRSMDADDNGYVTHDEARQWNREMREKHKAERRAARKAYKDRAGEKAKDSEE